MSRPQTFSFLKPGKNATNLIRRRLDEILASDGLTKEQRRELRAFLDCYNTRFKSPGASLVILGGSVVLWHPDSIKAGCSPSVHVGRHKLKAVLQAIGREERIA